MQNNTCMNTLHTVVQTRVKYVLVQSIAIKHFTLIDTRVWSSNCFKLLTDAKSLKQFITKTNVVFTKTQKL